MGLLGVSVLSLAVACGAVALLFVERVFRHRSARAITWAWLLLAAAAVLGYLRFSPDRIISGYDSYDLVHSYLNAKYFDELGYTRIYRACLLADAEGRDRLASLAGMRDLDDRRLKGEAFVRQVRARPDVVKRHFTPRRWAEFGRDFRVLDERLTPRTWAVLLTDHGYNATPAWHAAGHFFSSLVPARRVKWLCQVDTFLVALMFLAIARCHGGRVALIALVWLCISASTHWPGIGRSLLRYDWLAAAVAGTCLMSRGKYFTGGALVGWAALSRIFPAALLLFVALRVGSTLLARRQIDRRALRTIGGFLAVVALGSAMACLTVGAEQHAAFWAHLEARRFLLAGGTGPVRAVAAVGLLSLLALSIVPARSTRTAPDASELAQYGFFACALLVTAAWYYWTLQVVPVLLHARRRGVSPKDAWGLTVLFGIQAFGWAIGLALPLQYRETSLTLGAVWLYAAVICLWHGREWLQRERPPRPVIPFE